MMLLRSLPVFLLLIASTLPLQAADLPTMKRAPPGGGANNLSEMSMDGEAEESVKPDYALLLVEAANNAGTVAAATIENAKVSRSLLALLEKFHLSGSDVEAGELTISAQYREQKNPNSDTPDHILTGYRASTTYRVQIRDLDAAPHIAREIVQSGGNFYSGMSFELRDKPERLASLRDKALRKAVSEGQHFAEVAGVKLGDILQVAPVGSGALIGARTGTQGEERFSVPARVTDVQLRAVVRVAWELKSETACADDKASK